MRRGNWPEAIEVVARTACGEEVVVDEFTAGETGSSDGQPA